MAQRILKRKLVGLGYAAALVAVGYQNAPGSQCAGHLRVVQGVADHQAFASAGVGIFKGEIENLLMRFLDAGIFR